MRHAFFFIDLKINIFVIKSDFLMVLIAVTPYISSTNCSMNGTFTEAHLGLFVEFDSENSWIRKTN